MPRRAWPPLVLLALLGGAALLAPVLAPYDPRLPTGSPLLPPSAAHPLGTNDLGQDVLSAWLWGARGSLAVAAAVALISTALAWGVGLAAALSRRAEGPLLAVTDLLLAVPALPLYLLVVALVGPSELHLTLTLGLLSWPAFARVVRAQAIAVRGAPYVDAARALGASPLRLARRHVAPATLDLLLPKLVLTVRFAVFAEATLGFLGLGDPTAESWGTMLGRAFGDPLIFVNGAWTWWVLPPALAIVGAVVATAWLGMAFEPEVGSSGRTRRPALAGPEWLDRPFDGTRPEPRSGAPFVAGQAPLA